ncbi:hypothetical protein [Coralloluteibacterium thermophilus]|uniref:Uncharacterized protein n=1 Tax=Coralloluteibacterium thermophilum TaxID=2707049 RepID=A0ABV9NI37_9GAMM
MRAATDPHGRRRNRLRVGGAVAWPSFFAAGVSTMVFFAVVDPLALAAGTWPQLPVSRMGGYTIGFFMFWAATFSASLFTACLLAIPRRPRMPR